MNIVKEPIPSSIRFVTGPLAGKAYPLNKSVINLGREPGCDIVVSDPSVSRQHAQIAWNGGGWSITKLSPQNTLTLNQRDIQQSALNDRDVVGIGPGTTFIFQVEQNVQPPVAQGPLPSMAGTLPAAAPPYLPGQPNPPQANSPYPAYPQPQSGFAHGQRQPSNAPFAAQASMPQPAVAASAPPLVPQQGFPSTQQAPSPYAAAQPQVPAQPYAPPPYVAPSIPSQPPQVSFGQQEAHTQRAPVDEFGKPILSELLGVGGTPSLEVSTNTDHIKQVYPLAPMQQVFGIGRDPSNDIVINRPTVSSFHAQIVREGNQLVLVHPHPSRGHTLNGLTYRGQTVRGDEPFRQVLSRGDVFRISDENGTFVTLTYNDGSGMSQEALPEIRPIPLGAPVLTLGRAADNMVVLDHPQVSGYHARLEQARGGYRIVDLNSTNHVYVNAIRITHPRALKPGDEIRIGPFRLTFTGTQLTQHDESNGIRIDALHLKKEGNRGVVLINDISIAVPPRKFVALVGGSGAGKSTLMDALNGLRPAQQGAVLYNGQDYYRHLAAFSTQMGYVPQEDIIHRDLTVGRALYYAAKLRLPQDFTEAQIKERINEVLDDVEMKHRRNLLVSKLSGGQRKRVSIALELLANPSVFFLDEPTSGLDPGLDRKMMLLLRKLADKGHTIVLVTHATNNINACDYICFLCQGGRLAYFGPPNEAKTYFGKTDFAEIYSALEPSEQNPNIPAEAEAKFKQSPDYVRYVIEPLKAGPAGSSNLDMPTVAVKPPKRGNPWKQFILLSMRYLELILNDRVNLAILILQAPIIGLILIAMSAGNIFSTTSITNCKLPSPNGGMFQNCTQVSDFLKSPAGKQALQGGVQIYDYDQGKVITTSNANTVLNDSVQGGSGADAQKILLIMAFAAVMFGCINGAREIVKEAAIYKRERSVNLGIAPYLYSKIFVLGIFSLLQSFILVFLLNLRAPFYTHGGDNVSHIILFPPFIEIYISTALTALAGLMTGLLISAVVPNNDRAMSLVPLPLIPQVIFAGVIFTLSGFIQVPAAFFAARWGMAALGSTVGLHNGPLNVDSLSNVGMLFTNLDQSSMHAGAIEHLLLCWGVLLVMIVGQGALIAWFLKRKDVRH